MRRLIRWERSRSPRLQVIKEKRRVDGKDNRTRRENHVIRRVCLLSAARRPAPAAAPATPPVASTNGENSHRRRVITKPPVPKQTPVEKKPPVPRAARTPRPINAPTPDLKNVRSKIGSTDNMKYQPGGGKVGADCSVKVSKGFVVSLSQTGVEPHKCPVSSQTAGASAGDIETGHSWRGVTP